MSQGSIVEAEVGDQKIAAEDSEQLNFRKKASIAWDLLAYLFLVHTKFHMHVSFATFLRIF
jgi:hypothetical protein